MTAERLNSTEIKNLLPGFYSNELIDKMAEHGMVMEIPKNMEILREGQFVKVIPIVIEGLLKVYSRYEDKELLLYYIQPGESCIMSFSSSLQNEPSRVYAIAEEDSKVLVLPVEHSSKWVNQYPYYNNLFFRLYNQRYADLLETINHLLFHKLDDRIIAHLRERQILKGQRILKITHRQIAHELGTAREVISRIMKKLEKEKRVIQHPSGIEVL